MLASRSLSSPPDEVETSNRCAEMPAAEQNCCYLTWTGSHKLQKRIKGISEHTSCNPAICESRQVSKDFYQYSVFVLSLHDVFLTDTLNVKSFWRAWAKDLYREKLNTVWQQDDRSRSRNKFTVGCWTCCWEGKSCVSLPWYLPMKVINKNDFASGPFHCNVV